MIYDCFTFFNELDMLEIRLNVLNGVVDRFVLVEATRTHSNKPKELFFRANAARFEKFLHKIDDIVIDDYPAFETAWTYENHQRNCIKRGLQNCKNDDVILISDLDEIPRPEKILEYRNTPGIKSFEQRMHLYYLNHYCVRQPVWHGTKMLSAEDFRSCLDRVDKEAACCVKSINPGTTATKIRVFGDGVPVTDGGWHFTFLGGRERVREKLHAYAHEELNFPAFTDLRNIEKRMRADFDCHRLLGVELDETYPEYLRKNQDRYAHFIGPVTPPDIAERVRKTARRMAQVDRGVELAVKLLTGLIPVKKWRKHARTFLLTHLYRM